MFKEMLTQDIKCSKVHPELKTLKNMMGGGVESHTYSMLI